MKKTLILFLAAVLICASFGIINAADVGGKLIAQNLRGSWLMFVPQIQLNELNNWTSYVVVSNWQGFAVDVRCEFSSYSNSQIVKEFTLAKLGKRIFVVADEIGNNDVFDVWCTANKGIVGTTAIVINNATGQVDFIIPMQVVEIQ